jgi:hypothetical protein
MFALSHHMGTCMMNFLLAFYLSHIANFISHGEMHENFPIILFFCPFMYQLLHPMRKCMNNFSLLCICHFVGSTFTSNGEVHWEFAFGFLFACSYYQLWLGERFYHLWNLPQISPFDWPHLRYTLEICKFTFFSPYIWASFHPLISLLVISIK